ncbi:MAG: hypothetical protein SFX18_16230 [Pirellulales bacterium]|nr:hypothetical protein [Pirellulales bacterium]
MFAIPHPGIPRLITRFVVGCLWSLATLLTVSAEEPKSAPAQDKLATPRVTPLPPPQKPVNYADPPRDYDTVKAAEWTIHVERQLLTDAPEFAKEAQERLEKNLAVVFKLLPADSRDRLKNLEFYLMYGPKARGGGRDNGLEYFQKHAPDHDRQLDPRWRNCIVIYSAENYAWISDLWALKVLVHEYAHAHQLLQWPEDQPDILRAWDQATSAGLYLNVESREGNTIKKAYAAVNQLEYFAELSCIYFVGCEYHPFDRATLATYDPVGYALVEKMWGIKK